MRGARRDGSSYPEARITLFGHRSGHPGARFAFRKNFSEDDVRVYFEHFIKNSPFIERIDRRPAEQLGIQLSTARSRLKIILAKTGCSRQIDLMRLALSVPHVNQS